MIDGRGPIFRAGVSATSWRGSRALALRCTVSAALIAIPLPLSSQSRCDLAPLRTHAIHYCVAGSGAPTIVLAAGARLTSSTWDGLVPRLAELGTVVTFDRAGLGRSEAGPKPRTAIQIARELAELLEVARVSGPLVLVGHSTGGRHMLRFAELRPYDVLAVVLLDTPPPGFEDRRMELLTQEEQEERRLILERGAHDAPEVVRLEREGAAQDAEIPFGAFPRDLPLFVVAANRQDFGTLGSPEAHRELWVEMSRQWLDLSDASRMVLADGSGHMIHHHRPALVIRLIREIIEGTR